MATTATMQAAYGQLPLSFEANEGQSDAQVQFLARGHGYSLFLTSTEAVLTLRQQSARSEQRSSLDKARRLRSGQALRNPGRERGDSPDFIRATT